MRKAITVEAEINAPLEKVWDYWTNPKHITKWSFASDDWESPHAKNDLKIGGKFSTRMSSKNKKEGFDFEGIYTNIVFHKTIEYVMPDKRKVKVTFEKTPKGIKVTEKFDPESENSEEMQRNGWQSILNNFKKYVESH